MRAAHLLLIFLLLMSCSVNNGNRLSSIEFQSSWELVSFIDEKGEELTLYDYEVHTLRFDKNKNESELGGETACNFYGGKYRAFKNGTISIRDLAVTEALCRQPSWGDQFVIALVDVSEFNLSGGELVLKFGSKGKLKFLERLE